MLRKLQKHRRWANKGAIHQNLLTRTLTPQQKDTVLVLKIDDQKTMLTIAAVSPLHV